MKSPSFLVLLAACATSAGAANEFAPLSENRSLRQESRVETREFRQIPSALGGAAPQRWTSSIGLAYTDGEDGSRTLNTPFLLQRTLSGKDGLKVFGDGWTHTEPGAGAQDKNGLADVGVAYLRQLTGSTDGTGPKWSLRGDVGLVLPSGGDIGSKNAKERGGASYKREFGRWTGSLGGRLTRLDGPVTESTSRYARAGIGEVDYDLGADRSLSLQLSRSYRPGASGSTQVSAGYEWPFGVRHRQFVGDLAFTRGVTSGSRDNAVEFDLTWKF